MCKSTARVRTTPSRRMQAGQRVCGRARPDAAEPGVPARACAAVSGVRGRAPAGDRQGRRAGRASGRGQLVGHRAQWRCWRITRRAAALPRAGIVHRLDKDTSGLMVVGKTLVAVTALVRAIAAREVHREYLAIAHGAIARRDVAHRRADRRAIRSRASAWRWSPVASRARPTSRRSRGATASPRLRCIAAHRPHASDPRSPGVARPSAGGRRGVRRRARHWA